MKKLTKAVSLGLCAALAAGMTACSAPASSGAAGSTEGSTAGSAAGTTASGDIVNLKWVTVGTGMPANYDSWAAKVNEYLGEKIGVNIEMEVVPWGDWDARRSVIVNTGGDYDIVFGNMNVYANDVKLGAYLDLSEYLKNTPELYNSMPEEYWDAMEVDGKIYGVPTYKDSSVTYYLVWDENLAKENGIDPAQYTELDQLTEPLQKLHDATGEASFPLGSNGTPWSYSLYDNLGTGLPALGVRYNDEERKVVPVFEQQEIMDQFKLFRSWYESGIINADASTKAEENSYKICSVAQGWSGAAKTTWGPNMGVDAVAVQWSPTMVSNDSVRGSINSISANCKNPEKALEFLQLINTDSYLRDMFYYGEEGVDWEYVGEGADKRVHRNRDSWEMAGYTQGSYFIVTPTDAVEFNEWDEVKELNENAEESVMLGFDMDITNVADQIANCNEIYMRYRGEVTTGTIDPEQGVADMMDEMRAAGFDDIVKEAQAQVDAWAAENK